MTTTMTNMINLEICKQILASRLESFYSQYHGNPLDEEFAAKNPEVNQAIKIHGRITSPLALGKEILTRLLIIGAIEESVRIALESENPTETVGDCFRALTQCKIVLGLKNENGNETAAFFADFPQKMPQPDSAAEIIDFMIDANANQKYRCYALLLAQMTDESTIVVCANAFFDAICAIREYNGACLPGKKGQK